MAISATLFKAEDDGRSCWVFQDVHPGGAAFKAGVQPGDILLRVGENEITPPDLPLFPLGETTPVDIKRRDCAHVRLRIEVPKSKTKERPLIELQPVSSMKHGAVGWLKVCMFPGAIGIDVARDIDKAIKGLDCERLIIDLRGNTGGGIGCLRLMSYLTPDRVPVGYSVTRRRAEQSFSKEKLPVFDRIPSKKIGLIGLLLKFASRDQSVAIATERLGKQRFHGKVVLLVNEHSASSCEMVAAFASENKLATIVGTKTPGRLLGGHSFRVGNGYRIALPVVAYYTWNGTFLEGRGVTPDMEEPFSVSAIRNGRDAQLQRALGVANEL
jgi:C-terminal processing protease CtpA/Prc